MSQKKSNVIFHNLIKDQLFIHSIIFSKNDNLSFKKLCHQQFICSEAEIIFIFFRQIDANMEQLSEKYKS
jgi:hypothetical protein